MTDIAFSLTMFSFGVLTLSIRFLPPRPWLYVAVPLLIATIFLGLAHLVFRVRIMAPVSGLADTLIVLTGMAMLISNSILDWRARAKAKQAGSVQPQ
jgi:hypothetical protein